MTVVNLVKSILGGNSGETRNLPSEPVGNQSRNQSSNRSVGDTAENVRKRRTARLHDLRRDDDNTTYNGNSSAQM